MLRAIGIFLGKLYQLVISLVVVAFLAVAAWFVWHLYEEERLQNQFLKDGKVVEVTVSDVDWSRHSYRDMLGNSNYLTFPYQQKTYQTRYVFDTAWVSPGDRIRLLYHPGRDAFLQQHVERKPGRVVSRLVQWSSINGFSREYKLLVGFLAVATALFFFAGGVVVSITGWTFVQTVARFVLVLVLGIAALFFTYDTWEYFQYYRHVKTNGRPMDVTVLDTDRHRIGNSTRSSGFTQYRYDATFRYKPGERVVPITEDEYETTHPNDRLRVLYDESQDDFMSARYAGDYAQVIAPLFFWILVLVTGRNVFLKSEKKV
ncbi:hypothetical protein GCM10028803_42650 [Larkinella knui]|uniref:DUF3592 domain-containing protein n=1 Tax=Larkinella knui TaxID=2025310 RepID=A0A3P1CNI6_9BACT|nr:hypothetical protein [Larkinella knui]RRB14893.1 hypothetical protein EHT87_10015 [Larkinella knui]